jgi:hypothetical protein
VTRSSSLAAVLAVALSLAGLGCHTALQDKFQNPDTNPVRKVLKTTMPLAYAANLTMAALDGHAPSNVRFTSTGDPHGAPFLLEITVDAAFPLPQGIEATGVVLVAGLVTRDSLGHPDFVLMTVGFGELNVSKGTFRLKDVTAMPVVVETDLVTGQRRLYAVYANMDVDTGANPRAPLQLDQHQIDLRYERYQRMRQFDYQRRTTLEQDVWILTVDDHDTPADASDDSYLVGGAQQYVEADDTADLMQMFLLLQMKPSCKANPTDGGGFLQNVKSGHDYLEAGQVALGVTGKCDGRMRFLAGTGSYLLLVDKPFPLHLDQ